MEVPIVISGGGIIGNYISLRLEKNNIKTVIVEKASGFLALDKGIRTVTLSEHSMQMVQLLQLDHLKQVEYIHQ